MNDNEEYVHLNTLSHIPLVLGGKNILEAEMYNLWRHLDLIDYERDYKTFVKFLGEPYFVKDPEATGTLFTKMYAKYRSTKSLKFYRATGLFQQLGLGGTKSQNTNRVGKLLRALVAAIREYRVQKFLTENSGLRDMILVEAIKMEGHDGALQLVMADWKEKLEELPLGTQRLYQRWKYEDAVHFNPSQAKLKVKHGNLPATLAAFQAFKDFYGAFYVGEDLGRKSIVKTEPNWEVPPSMAEDRLLHDFYVAVCRLRVSTEFDEERYQDCVELFLLHYERLAPYHRLVIFVHLENYLTLAHRQQIGGNSERIRTLLELVIDDRFLNGIESITLSFYINRNAEALILEDGSLAEQLRAKLLSLVPIKDRRTADLIGRTRVLLMEDRHRECLQLIKKELKKLRLRGYHQLIGLKHTQLRSALILSLSGEDSDNLFERSAYSMAKLVTDNPNDFAGNRKEEILCFIRICEQLYRTDLHHCKPKQYHKIRRRILDAPVLVSRNWLHCLLAHFNPDLKPRPAELRPTRNQGQPWASQE